MKTLNTFSSVAATLLATAIALSATVSLTACGKDNTAGTDEQQNSITAALDSAITVWLAGDTLVATEISGKPCIDCPHDIIIHDPADDTQVPIRLLCKRNRLRYAKGPHAPGFVNGRSL